MFTEAGIFLSFDCQVPHGKTDRANNKIRINQNSRTQDFMIYAYFNRFGASKNGKKKALVMVQNMVLKALLTVHQNVPRKLPTCSQHHDSMCKTQLSQPEKSVLIHVRCQHLATTRGCIFGNPSVARLTSK